MSGSNASMNAQASTPVSTLHEPVSTVRNCANRLGCSPPGLKSGPRLKRSAIPLNPLANSSAESRRRPVAGSFR